MEACRATVTSRGEVLAVGSLYIQAAMPSLGDALLSLSEGCQYVPGAGDPEGA